MQPSSRVNAGTTKLFADYETVGKRKLGSHEDHADGDGKLNCRIPSGTYVGKVKPVQCFCIETDFGT
jgi:hypothetical protein